MAENFFGSHQTPNEEVVGVEFLLEIYKDSKKITEYEKRKMFTSVKLKLNKANDLDVTKNHTAEAFASTSNILSECLI